jgi:PAS domain S-box-containing protein
MHPLFLLAEVMTVTTPHTYSILVVEDDPDIVIGLRDLLQHDGYAVTVAGSCASAIALIHAQRFNAILLDLGLPDGDGIDVLKEVKQLDASLPVIIVTAHIATERTVGSLTKGAFAYLTKPYNKDELRHTLHRAIGVTELTVKAARAEQTVSEHEDRFRSLVESASDAIVIADGSGTIISWNKAASALFGYSDEEAIGSPLTLLMPQRYHDGHRKGLARIEATGERRAIGSVIELHGLTKDGTEFPIELSLGTWKTAEGNFYSGVIRDISERKKAAQALEQLQRQHSLILTQAGEGIYGLDVTGNTTFVNPSAASMLGYDVEDLLGRHMHEILHHSRPDGTHYPAEECPIYAAIRDGLVHRVNDEVFWRKDGTSFPIEYIGAPIREANRVVGAVIVFRDITDRRKAEMALRLSEERLDLVVRGSHDGFWDGHVLPDEPWHSPRTPVWWSPRVREMLGYTVEEFPDVLESWISRLHPEDRNAVFAALTAHIECRVPYDVEYRLLTKQGGYHWFRARGQGFWDAGGRLTRMAGSLQSIMDRKQAEEAIRRSQQLLQEMANHTTAVIYVKDLDGRFLFVNRRFEEIFNLTPSQIIGHTNHEIFPRDIADAFRANDLKVLEQNRSVEYEEQALHADGLHTYLSIKLPLCNKDGTPYATCGISTDITERKLNETALHAHKEQLRLALTSSEVGGWDWDCRTGQFCWSRQVDRFLGLSDGSRPRSQEEWLALVYPEDRQTMAQAMRRAMDQAGTEVVLEHRVLRPDGTLRWFVWTGQILRDRDGRAVHMLGMVRATQAVLDIRPERTMHE